MKNKEIIKKVFDTYNKPNFRMQFDMASDMLTDLLNKALKLKEKDVLGLMEELEHKKFTWAGRWEVLKSKIKGK